MVEKTISLSFYRQLLFCLVVGFLMGVWLAINIVVHAVFLFFILWLGFSALFLAWRFKISRNWLILIALLSVGVWLGISRVSSFSPPDYRVCQNLGSSFSGLIVSEPKDGEFYQQFLIRPDNQNFNVLISTKRNQVWHYGDKIKFFGQLIEPENFSSNNSREFSYRHYLLKDNILCLGRNGRVELIERDEGFFIYRYLFAAKRIFLNTINHFLPATESSLLAGILLGVQSSLPKDVSQNYQQAGLSHILVLSGQNISIVASILLIIFGWAGPWLAFILVAIGLVLFAIMAGAGASIVRASIMGLLAVLARASGRPYAGGLSLMLAGAVMVWLNPRILVFDLGFQLSFLATLGIFYGPPLVTSFFNFLPARWGIRDIASISASAIIFTSPLIAYSFGQFSLVALPANILVVPLVETTMLSGFAMVILGLFFGPLAWPMVYLVHILLKINLSITGFFAQWPYASLTLKSFSWQYLIIFYFFLAILIFNFSKRQKKLTTFN